ncbi:MAG: hypothetical protein ACREQ5_08425 [Candidatus Dormibacteria bacterium]
MRLFGSIHIAPGVRVGASCSASEFGAVVRFLTGAVLVSIVVALGVAYWRVGVPLLALGLLAWLGSRIGEDGEFHRKR